MAVTVYIFGTDRRVRTPLGPEQAQDLIHDENEHKITVSVSAAHNVKNGEYIGFRCVDEHFRLFCVTNTVLDDDKRLIDVTATDAIVQDMKEAIIGSTENGYRVLIEDGVAKLADRSAFAGSVATDDRLVRTMHTQAGVPLHECVRMMSLTPAKILGIDGETGSLEAGKRADLVVFDENITIKGVCAAGHGKTGLLA